MQRPRGRACVSAQEQSAHNRAPSLVRCLAQLYLPALLSTAWLKVRTHPPSLKISRHRRIQERYPTVAWQFAGIDLRGVYIFVCSQLLGTALSFSGPVLIKELVDWLAAPLPPWPDVPQAGPLPPQTPLVPDLTQQPSAHTPGQHAYTDSLSVAQAWASFLIQVGVALHIASQFWAPVYMHLKVCIQEPAHTHPHVCVCMCIFVTGVSCTQVLGRNGPLYGLTLSITLGLLALLRAWLGQRYNWVMVRTKACTWLYGCYVTNAHALLHPKRP